MRRVPGGWVDQLDDLDDPEIRFGRRVQRLSLGPESDRQLYDVDALVMRNDSLVIRCWEAGGFAATFLGADSHGWAITVPPKWKDRLLEILAFQTWGAIPYGDRNQLLLHLIAERFERSDRAAVSIEDWLRSNHVPYERS